MIISAPLNSSLYLSAKALEPSRPNSSAFKATNIISRSGSLKVEKVFASSNKKAVPDALSKAPE